MRVAGKVSVDRSFGQGLEKAHGLLIGLAARRIFGIGVDHSAAATHVADDDDRVDTRGAQLPRCLHRGRHRIAESERRHIRRGRDVRRIRRGEADDANLRAPGLDDRVALRPRRRRPGCLFGQIRREEGKLRHMRVLLQRPERVLAGEPRHGVRTDRTVVELVIADGSGVVTEGVVAFHYRLAFEEVRFECPLEEIAGVDDDDTPMIGAQDFEIPGHERQSAVRRSGARVVMTVVPAVQIGGAGHEDMDRLRLSRSSRDCCEEENDREKPFHGVHVHH